MHAEWGRPIERDRDVAAIAQYHEALAEGDQLGLDERTATDLDLDAVFALLDRTQSPVGQRVLYHRLRTSPTLEDRTAFESLLIRVGRDTSEREQLQASLSRLRDCDGEVWWLTQPGVVYTKPRDHAFLLLGVAAPATLFLAVVWPPALLATAFLILVNMAVRYRVAPRLRAPLHHFRQVAPLLNAAQTARCLFTEDLHPIGESLPEDLVRLRRLRRLAGWVSHDPMASDDLTGLVAETANVLLLLDVVLLVLASREIQAQGAPLLRTFDLVGTVDAAIGVASYRAGTAIWTRPVFRTERLAATLVDVRHPLLLGAVPNSIELPPGRGALVTGSNMSGKSTFVKSVGLNVVLAQTINTCLATRYEAPILVVRSVIRRSDDVAGGRSYYRDEVEAVLSRVNASRTGPAHLFLFDELFRGTSTVERIAAAEATLKELVDDNGDVPSNHIVIAATHDRELVELMPQTYVPYHFGDHVDVDGLAFDYRLRRGPARSWNAIALLEICGAPPRLVGRALRRTERIAHQQRPRGQGLRERK